MPARPAGEESLRVAVAAQAIEAQPVFGQIKPKRGRVVRAQTASSEEDMKNSEPAKQEAGRVRRGEGSHGAGKGGSVPRETAFAAASTTPKSGHFRQPALGNDIRQGSAAKTLMRLKRTTPTPTPYSQLDDRDGRRQSLTAELAVVIVAGQG